MSKAQISFSDASTDINFSQQRQISLEEVRKAKEALMPDGEHAWVINAIYVLDDPEQAMDEMELGADNFIGVTTIHCLLCHEHYSTEKRHHKCPKTIKGS